MNGNQYEKAEQDTSANPTSSPQANITDKDFSGGARFEQEQENQAPLEEEGRYAFPSPFGEKRNDVEDNKLWAISGYFFVFSIIPLLMKRESAYAQYHAKQGVFLFGVFIIYSFLGMFLSLFLGNFIGSLLLFYWIPGTFAIFVLFILGIMNAANGDAKPLPLFGKFAEKLNI